MADGFRPSGGEPPAYQRQTELDGYDFEKCNSSGLLLAGTGRLGGYLATHAVQLPFGLVKGVDFDVVTSVNLQAGFVPADLGLPKPIALIRGLEPRCVAPIRLQAIPYSIEQAVEEVPDLFEGITHIAAALDGFEGRVYINRVTVERKLPAIFLGVSEDARHCEVVLARPDRGEA